MGTTASSLSSNVSRLSANTDISTVQSCSATQFTRFEPTTVNINTAECGGDFTLGNISNTQVASCKNSTELAVLSKVLVDQSAKATSKAGIGIMTTAVANANNFSDVQNNINALMQSSCNNSQQAVVAARVFNIGTLKAGGDCNIANSNFTQQSACINDIMATLTNDSTVSQTAEASATAGLDLGALLGILIAIVVIIMLVFLGIPFMLTVTAGGKASGALKSAGGLFHSGGPPISELRATLSELQAQVLKKGIK